MVSIIIVTYNSDHLIASCLDNLGNSKNIEIIIVDNASEDNTCKIISKNYPHVKLIKAGRNSGYGIGNNIGVKAATKDICLIINPDVIITDKQVLKLAEHIDKAAVIAPRVEDPEGRSQQRGEWLVGACLMFKRKEFVPFDENCFLYYEEEYFLTNMGSSKVIDSIKIVHLTNKSSETTNQVNPTKEWHFIWSRFYYQDKKGKWWKKYITLFRYSIKLLFYYLTFNIWYKKKYTARVNGLVKYIKGVKAFDKNGNGRMFNGRLFG